MSLAGRLEDVSVSDVMQFIHLGRRTGTLRVRNAQREAWVLFHSGSIVGGRSATGERIGALLVTMGALTQEQCDRALERQKTLYPERTLGQNLMDMGHLDLGTIRTAVRQQVETTIYDLVGWEVGTFEFELDLLEPIDEIAFLPADLLPELDLNTQMILLEAARVFDEKHRREAASPINAAQDISSDSALDGIDNLLVETREPIDVRDEVESLRSLSPTARLEVISQDKEMISTLGRLLQGSGSEVRRVTSKTAGSDSETPAIIAFDFDPAVTSADNLEAFCRRNQGTPVLCILDDVTLGAQAYAAGATAVVPRNPAAIVGCFTSLTRFQGSKDTEKPAAASTDFQRLHRIVADLRSGVFSASVALSLMKVISESVERAVLFLVKGDSLTALGAFGFDHEGRPLAVQTRGLQLALADDDGFSQALEGRRAMTVSLKAARLQEEFLEAIGHPVYDEIALFPVLGVDRVILVVYADNGLSDHAIEEIDILDLAAAEVGIAFENELLRRQLSKQN